MMPRINILTVRTRHDSLSSTGSRRGLHCQPEGRPAQLQLAWPWPLSYCDKCQARVLAVSLSGQVPGNLNLNFKFTTVNPNFVEALSRLQVRALPVYQ